MAYIIDATTVAARQSTLLHYYCACQNSTDSPNKVCLGTRVNPCCPNANFSLGNLVSSTKVSVAEEDITVEYYLTLDSTEGAGKHSMPIKIITINA